MMDFSCGRSGSLSSEYGSYPASLSYDSKMNRRSSSVSPAYSTKRPSVMTPPRI